jgi:hypothetical protein
MIVNDISESSCEQDASIACGHLYIYVHIWAIIRARKYSGKKYRVVSHNIKHLCKTSKTSRIFVVQTNMLIYIRNDYEFGISFK